MKTTREAAEYLGLEERTILDLKKVGVLTSRTTHPKLFLYTVEDLDALAIRLGLQVSQGEAA